MLGLGAPPNPSEVIRLLAVELHREADMRVLTTQQGLDSAASAISISTAMRSTTALLLILLLGVLPGCFEAPDVPFTSPSNGSTGIPIDTKIVVNFSTEMDPETSTEQGNYSITGALSGSHTSVATLNEDGRELTVVPDEPFLEGEQVTAVFTSGIRTVINIPIEPFSIIFTTTGSQATPGDFDPQDGEFLLTNLSPPGGSVSISRRPTLVADFEMALSTASAQGSVTLHGERSGVHEVNVIATNGGDETSQLRIQLPSSEPALEPGERAWITFTGSITAAASGPGGSAVHLRPYIALLEARSGHVTGGYGPADPLAIALGEEIPGVLHLEAVEMLPYTGLELVAIGTDGVVRLMRKSGATWIIVSSLGLEASPICAVAADLDDDGISEVVVVTDDHLVHQISTVGQELVEGVDPIDLGFTTPNQLRVADVDGNGMLDVVLATDSGVRFMGQYLLLDPDTFTLSRELVLLTTTPLADPTSELDIGDLDGDGRLDIVARTVNGVAVLRGAGSLSFLEVSYLSSDVTQGPVAISDFDGDGVQDVVVASSDGIQFFPGEHAGIPEGDWGSVSFQTGGSPTAMSLGNIDGDPAGLVDLLVLQPGAVLPLVLFHRLSTRLVDVEVEEITLPYPVSAGGVLCADLDGDLGRDLVVALVDGSGNVPILTAQSTGVVDAGDPGLSFGVPSQVSVGLGTAEFDILVDADLDASISDFQVVMQYDPSVITLVRIEADPTTFPFGSVSLEEHIETATGVGVALGQINGYLPQGSGQALVRYVFSPVPGQVGNADYSLADGLVVAGTAYSNEVVLEGDGSLVAVDISMAQGTVTVESSVPAVENLQCLVALQGSEETVAISWTNGTSYDSAGGIEIRRNGSLLVTLAGFTTSYNDLAPTVGSATYEVTGFQGGIPSLPESCDISLVPTPSLSCSRDPFNPTRIRLVWTTPVSGYTGFEIRRDGNLLATVGSSTSSYSDPIDLHGHFYQLVAQQGEASSAPSACSIEDSGSAAGTVLDPLSVTATVSNYSDVTVSWVNAENYDVLSLEGPFVTTSLPGDTVSVFIDDYFPGSYQFIVTAGDDGISSNPVTSNVVETSLRPPTDLQCALTSGNDAVLTWNNGPVNYDYDSIIVERASGAGVETFFLDGTATSFTDPGIADGEYSYTVFGRYTVDGTLYEQGSGECSVSIRNVIEVDSVVTTLGAPSIDFDVRGQLLTSLAGWSFFIDYDSSRLQGVSAIVPGVDPGQVIVSDAPLPGLGNLHRLSITVSGVTVAGGADVVLARVTGTPPAEFDLAGISSLHLVDSLFDPLDGGPLIEPLQVDGQLNVASNALRVDDLVVQAGNELVVWAFGTYEQALTGYTASINYDPSVLQCLEVSNVGTVGEDLSGPFSFFFSGFDNVQGAAYGSVISAFDALPPAIGVELAYFRFQALPGIDPGTVTALEFGAFDTGSSLLENLFVDENAGTIIPAMIGSEITIGGITLPPELDLIDPDHGPTTGGTGVLLSGAEFTSDSQAYFGDQPAATTVLSSSSLIAVTPPQAAGIVDVTVVTGNGEATLPGAFTYETVTVSGYSPQESPACGGITMTISGSGLMDGLQVVFGAQAAVTAEVSSDGTFATAVVPPVPLGTGTVDLLFTDPNGVLIASFPAGFTYIDDTTFIRGDANCDGIVNTADIGFITAFIAGAGSAPVNPDAADVNDDGVLHVGDAIYLSSYLFSGGAPPPPPFPEPGEDPTPDGL